MAKKKKNIQDPGRLPGGKQDTSGYAVPQKKESTKGKFKRAGHLNDQILKYSSTRKTSSKDDQLSLFDVLKPKTIEDIEVSGVEVTQVVEGIRLTSSETKIIDCLSKLLHSSSQNIDPKNSDYYSGNKGVELIPWQGEKTPAPRMAFTLYELTKEYKGGEDIGGKDLKNVTNTLVSLSKKQFLLKYKETTFNKDGSRVEKEIETFEKIVNLPTLKETKFNKEGIEISKKEETLIILHPIFRRQIDTKFILYPDDITKRTIDAYGSHNLSEGVVRLRDWLMKERSYKHYATEIYMHNLLDLVAENYMRNSRKSRAKEILNKAIESMKVLGLLEKVDISKGSTGEDKVTFFINEDWE